MKSETEYPALHQHEIAVRRMEKKHPKKAARINTLLNVFDKQAFDNLSTFTTADGSVIPYTKIHLSYIPDVKHAKKKNLHEKYNHQEDQPVTEKKVVVIFNGFAVPEQGHPIYPEIFYDLPFSDMERAKHTGKTIEATYLCVGQATGLGGVASKEANKWAKKEEFRRETKLIADFAKQFLPENEQERDKTKMHFYGISMGALKAGEACFQSDLPDNKKMVEMINPPRIPGLEKSFQPSTSHIFLGYVVEGSIKNRFSELKEEIIPSEYTKALESFFEQKGLTTKDTARQRLTKERAIYLNVRNISKNKLHTLKGEDFPFPVHVHVSALDPITFSFAGLETARRGETIKNGNVIVDFNLSTHTTDHYPVDKWASAMEGVSVKRM